MQGIVHSMIVIQYWCVKNMGMFSKSGRVNFYPLIVKFKGHVIVQYTCRHEQYTTL